MTALLLTFAVFAAWWVIGLALLAAVRADTTSLRVTLTAPALGSCTVLLPAFVLSHAGMAIEDLAIPLVVLLLVGAAGILVVRRPRLPVSVVPVIAVCVAGLFLAAWPMLEFGFHWLANGNDDMANYTLSAQQLLHHGLLAPTDTAGLINGRDYATTLTELHIVGSRPGADLMLAVISSVTGRLPYEVFMPLTFAFNLCCVCAAGALAMQGTRRWWAATLAAVLLVVSPLATFGVLQQLIAQVWGLALGVALFALLMRSELHRNPAKRIAEAVPIGVLAAGLVVVYVELASALAAAYALYVMVLAVRRELSPRAVLRLWLPAAAVAVLLLNTYLVTELRYVGVQANAGVGGGKGVPLFGFTLVPSALPGVLGLQELRPLVIAPRLGLSIAAAGILLLGALAGCLASARRGIGAAVVLVTLAVLAAVLAVSSSDFGMFKLFMYLQPFLAAVVAVWLAGDSRLLRWILVIPVALVVAAQFSTQHAYVQRSRNPIELPHASASDVLPAFRQLAAEHSGPIVAESENPILIKLEAEIDRGRPIFFLGRDSFDDLLGVELHGKNLAQERRAEHAYAWKRRAFGVVASNSPLLDRFSDDVRASESLASPSCELVLPTGSEIVFNRRSLPEGSPGLTGMRCSAAHNLLLFISSELGEAYYIPQRRQAISFFQLEQDYFFPGHTFSGFGRYVLVRALGASPGARLELNITETLRHDGSNRLPPAAVVGATRTSLPVVGRGSARLFSQPLRYQMIAGVPYLLLDLGQDGRLPDIHRSGLEGLYGRSEIIDPRFLTAYVRGISLIGGTEYARLRPPLTLSHFPSDLANDNLEYSGIYEDGWIGDDSYAVLSGGPAADLVVRAAVPFGAGKHLDVLLDGHVVASLPVAPGPLSLRVHVPRSDSRRRVELRFAATVKLHAPDLRPASALLSFLGFVTSTHGG